MCITTVLSKGGQVWGRDQDPDWQAERGEQEGPLYDIFYNPKPLKLSATFNTKHLHTFVYSLYYNLLTFAFSSQAETRAEFAERSVAKLEKTIDDLEGTTLICVIAYLYTIYCNTTQQIDVVVCNRLRIELE